MALCQGFRNFKWVSRRPRVLLIEDFLSPLECQRLRALSAPRLERCTVDDAQESPLRTCSGAWLPRSDLDGAWSDASSQKLLRNVELKVAKLTQFPVNHGEPAQVLRYGAGDEYKLHHDFLEGAEDLANGGQRLATLLIYLSTVPAQHGGATIFPHAQTPRGKVSGARVQPVEGRALLWWNTLDTGQPDLASEHRSEPMQFHRKKTTEKWALSKWIREQPFQLDEDAAAKAGF
ncbi:hypothetical protein M885DRAFT_517159 [Pelagophyceae sp. CCMP2097]|nr:hypothetical protein M885DRAFT_517159 [Pelagophyceae sp. CCMP2097]